VTGDLRLFMSHTARRKLSVVVIITGDTAGFRGDLRELERSLAALEQQQNAPPMQVIVPYYDLLSNAIAPLERAYPWVEFVRVTDLKTWSGNGGRDHHDELRARAVLRATGDIIAFLEDHVYPDPNWAVAFMRAHAQPFAGIGGAVENAVDRPLWWAAYFCDLGQYQNPVPDGESRYASLVNSSYKRAALDDIRAFWVAKFNETVVHGALHAHGFKLALTSHAIVRQHREQLNMRLATREFYLWGRSYASTRSAGLSSAARFAYIAGAPCLPLLLIARACRNVIRSRRHSMKLITAMPYVSVLVASWSFGEFRGYLRPVAHCGHTESVQPSTAAGVSR
jgi:hypothetical protein